MSVRRSLAWSYAAQAYTFVVTFGISVVVARILGPYEMGIFAVGMSVVGALSVLSVFGVGPFLVRHEAPTPAVIASVFTINLILNAVVAIAIVGVVAIGPAFGVTASVASVLLVLASLPLLTALEFLPITLLQREMDFKTIAVVSMVRATVNGGTMLGLALAGYGHLSPAIAAMAAACVSALAFNIAAARHASFRLGLDGWREIAGFGMTMMSIGGLSLLVQRVSELILVRLLGIAALGIYTRASSLANQVWDNVYGIGTRVIFSQMAGEMRDTGTVRRTFVHGIALITALIWPLLVGLAVLSGPLVHALYGDAWLAAALPLSILLIVHVVGLGFGMNWELCVLRKRTAWQARNEGVRAVVGLAAFAIGASFSLAGAAMGRIVEALCGLALFGPRMRDLAGTARGEIGKVYAQSAVLTIAAAAPVAAVMAWSRWSPVTPWTAIVPAIVAGIALWFAVLRYFEHPLLAELVRSLRWLRRSVPPPSS